MAPYWIDALDDEEADGRVPEPPPAPPPEPEVLCGCGRVFEKGEVRCRGCGEDRPIALPVRKPLPATPTPSAWRSLAAEYADAAVIEELEDAPALIGAVCAHVSTRRAEARAVALLWERASGHIRQQHLWTGRLVGRTRQRMAEIRTRAALQALQGLTERPGPLLVFDPWPDPAGHASIIGVALDHPTVGVARTAPPVSALEDVRGAWAPVDAGTSHPAAALRVRPGAAPILVRPGHRADPGSAAALVAALCPVLSPSPLRSTSGCVPEPLAAAARACLR